MEIDITVKNYRCFPDDAPARITISDGFTAFIGVNNSGKSSLLKFLYEFRLLFQTISANYSVLTQALRHANAGLVLSPSISDSDEVFNKGNERDIQIEIHIKGESGPHASRLKLVEVLKITFQRQSKTWIADAVGVDSLVNRGNAEILSNWIVLVKRDP